jgi:hypothetical protein
MKDKMDIVERLRAVPHIMGEARLCAEAADEIELLRVALHKSEAGLLLAQLELQVLTGQKD